MDFLSVVIRRVEPLEEGSGIMAAEARALKLLARGSPGAAEIRALGALPAMEGLNRPTVVLRAVEATGGAEGSLEMAALLLDGTLATTRAGGQALRALLHASRGRFTAADAALDRAADASAAVAWSTRAALALNPAVAVPDAELDRLLAARPPAPDGPRGQATLYNLRLPRTLAVLETLLLVRRGRFDAVRQRLGEMEPDTRYAGAIPTIRAWTAFRSGDVEGAARIVRKLPAPLATSVRLFGLGAFLHGEILREAGHPEEALVWYESTAMDLRFDLFYRSLSYLRRGQLLEELGRRDEARRAYLRFLDRWSGADPEAAGLVARARDGLGGVGAE